MGDDALIHIAGEMTTDGQACLYCHSMLVAPGPSRFAIGSMVGVAGARAFVVDRALADNERFCELMPKIVTEIEED